MTSSRAGASVVPVLLVSSVTDARQVTGASRTVEPASATDTLMNVTSGLGSALTVGTTLGETCVTGESIYYAPMPLAAVMMQQCGFFVQ